MSSLSFSPVKLFQSLTTFAAGADRAYTIGDVHSMIYSIDPVTSRKALAVYKGVKNEIKLNRDVQAIHLSLMLDAHFKKLSQRCINTMSKIFGLLPEGSQISLQYSRMHDSDVAGVLKMIKPTITTLGLIHSVIQEMGASVITELAGFLVEREACLLKLTLAVQHIGHHALYLLSDALSKTHSLSCLRLAGMKLNEAQLLLLQKGLSANSSIRVLQLSGLQLPPSQGQIFKAIFESAAIEHLILCGGQPEVISAVTESFSSAPKLRELTIGDGSALEPQEAEVIGSAMSSAPYLETLEFKTFSLLGESTSSFILSFSKSLENGSAIQKISLNSAQISDEDGVLLANALQAGNSQLKHLILPNNELGDQAAAAFAKMLRTNSSLRTLDLDLNQFTIQGVSAMLRSLIGNNSLRNLSVLPRAWNGTYASEELIMELAQIIEELKAHNGALTLPWVQEGLTEEIISMVERTGQLPPAVIEVLRFLERNRHNEKARDATLFDLLFPVLNEESSSSPTCSSS